MGRSFRKQRAPSSWRKLSLATWSRPSDPSVYGLLELDATRAIAYVERAREVSGVHVTLTHLVGKALALAIREHPEVNAIVRRGALYERQTVDVFFQVAFDRGADLSGAKIARADEKSVPEIAAQLASRAASIRAKTDRSLLRAQTLLDRLPGPLRRLSMRLTEIATYELGLDLRAFGVPYDPFGSAMVTNVARFGLTTGFAPLVPFARAPIVLTVGRVSEAPLVVGSEIAIRPLLRVGATFDHRILDGAAAGALAERFLAVMAEPERALGALEPEAPGSPSWA